MAFEIAGLGPASLVPRSLLSTKDQKELAQYALGAEEGFVLSRVDGRTTIGEICALVPFPPSQTAAILESLIDRGAIELPGRRQRARTTTAGTTLKLSTDDIQKSAEKAGGLTEKQRKRIDEVYLSLSETNDPFVLLQVKPNADAKTIKRAYFRLSKEFHPDRYFGKKTGDYAPKLITIFQTIKGAFELLSDDARKAEYLLRRKK